MFQSKKVKFVVVFTSFKMHFPGNFINKDTHRYVSRINYLLLIAVCIMCIFPFVILSIYVHPNAEDYSHSFLPKYSSTLYFVFDFFKNKEARLFTNLLYAINPLRYDAMWAYKLIPPVLLSGLTVALYFLIKNVFLKKHHRLAVWLLTFLIISLFLGQAPSPVHILYWMSSSFNYTTSLILLLLLCTSVYSTVRNIRIGTVIKKRKMVLMVILLYALVLSNEIFIFSTLFLSGMLFLRSFFFRLPERLLYLVLSIAALLASVIYFIPHLLIPEASHEVIHLSTMPVLDAVWFSFKNTFLNLIQWSVLNPPLLIFSVLLFYYIRNFTDVSSILSIRSRSLIFYAITTFIFLVLWLVPYYIFRGFEHIPQRIFNMQFFVFILMWLYMVVFAASHRPRGIPERPLKPVLILFTVVAFAVTAVGAPNIWQAYSDLLGGKAAAYDREIEVRLTEFKRAAQRPDRTAHITVLQNRPFTIYFPPELEPDTCRNIWNTAYENYFNLVEIKVTGPVQKSLTP